MQRYLIGASDLDRPHHGLGATDGSHLEQFVEADTRDLAPNLVFMVVDNLFGGDGRFVTKSDGREFTNTEQRIMNHALNARFCCGIDTVAEWEESVRCHYATGNF